MTDIPKADDMYNIVKPWRDIYYNIFKSARHGKFSTYIPVDNINIDEIKEKLRSNGFKVLDGSDNPCTNVLIYVSWCKKNESIC